MSSDGRASTPRVSFEQDVEAARAFRIRFRMCMKVLGRGADAVVYEGRDMYSKKQVAMKLVSLSEKEGEEGRRAELIRRHMIETQILSSLAHEHIVRTLDHCEKPERLIMVMELAEGGDLLNKITELNRIKEDDAKGLVASVASAIEYIHGLNIVHRDIKAENILLRSPNNLNDVVLSDFGLAAYCQGNNLTQRVGTTRYAAPEILSGEKYGKAVDVWAFGVTVYLLLLGGYPFYDEDENALTDDILLGNYSLRSNTISSGAKDLIRGLIDINAQTRFTIQQVLSHSWIHTPSEKVVPKFPQENRFEFDVKPWK